MMESIDVRRRFIGKEGATCGECTLDRMSEPLVIVFLGTPDFAVPSLRALAGDPAFRIGLVVTQPDRPAGRGGISSPPPVKLAAQALGLPVFQPEDANASLSEMPAIPDGRPDVLVVVAYGQILREEILAWPRIAPVNVHPSLLPRWRGASPIQHAILAGDRETGVTVQRIVRELDAGPILAQRATVIGPRETAEALSDRLAELGAALLTETLKEPLRPAPQDPAGVTVCRKLTRSDGIADPETMTAEEIDRRVRALVPWPGVTCAIDGVPLKLLGTALEPAEDALPLPCRDRSTLYVTLLQPPGKNPMSGAAWLRGRRAKEG
jgi:methionyl-tRNA formyltransferase